MNDGSSDGSAQILENYATRFRIDSRSSPSRIGPTLDQDVAIKQSESEFVAFLDSDDLWAPDKLERQVDLMAARPDTGLCYTAARQIRAGCGCRSHRRERIAPGALCE